MVTQNKELMRQARMALKGKWGLAIGVCFVWTLVSSLVNGIPGAGPAFALIIAGPFIMGLAIFSLAFSRGQAASFGDIFRGFNHFGRAVGTYLLMVLYVLLWSLLLIVPGIIASLGYSQVFYIMVDDESIVYGDALAKSKLMMKGYKWKYFCLHLRFIGWAILSMLSLGIGFLWLFPYVQISLAMFYNDLKKAAAAAPQNAAAPTPAA